MSADKNDTPNPMCPSNYRIMRKTGQTIYVRLDVFDAQLKTLLTHSGDVLKDSPKAVVRKVGHWVVKETKSGGVKAVRHTLQRDKFRSPWLASHRLREHGVRVPEPLAFVEKEKLGIVTGTVFIFQHLAGHENVEEYLLALIKQGAGADTLGKFLEHLADAVNGIEASSAYHADLSGKNIFTKDGEHFYFIDLDAVELDTGYDEEKRFKNHVQLYDSFCDAMGDPLLVPFIEKMLPPEGINLRVWMPRVRKAQQERRTAVEAKWEKQGIRPRRIRDELPGV